MLFFKPKYKNAKDYLLIKDFAKKSKSYEKVDSTSFMMISFYGEAPISLYFAFKAKTCVSVEYSVDQIYDLYASKESYPSCEAFCDAFVKQFNWYSKTKIGEKYYLKCDLTKDYVKSDVSQALLDFSLFCKSMNKFFGKNFDEGFTESDIRAYSRDFYNKSMNLTKIVSIVSLVLSILSLILGIKQDNGALVVLVLAFLVVAGISFVKFRNFKRLLSKLRSK